VTDANETVDLGEVVRVLRLADAGWPEDRTDFDAGVVGFAGWNGYLDHDATLTRAGRDFLAKYGFLSREA
jgi:hypothetical protein